MAEGCLLLFFVATSFQHLALCSFSLAFLFNLIRSNEKVVTVACTHIIQSAQLQFF